MDKKGLFSASRIGDLLAGGTGKTKLNYIKSLIMYHYAHSALIIMPLM